MSVQVADRTAGIHLESTVSRRENPSMNSSDSVCAGEQEPWDLTWPSLPRWRTSEVTGNKSHFLDSYTSGHTCTEDKTHTNKKGARLKSPVHLQQPQHGVGRAAGTAPPQPSCRPTLPAVQRSWESAELTERQFQKILEIIAKSFHTRF